jgi:hypothetical protein
MRPLRGSADLDRIQIARQIHWRVPVTMLCSFVFGVSLAIGHHFFYLSRDGSVVRDQSQQAWDTRIGLGLAFLVKLFLATAVSIACVQNFWWILRSRPVPLAGVDSMFDLLGNAWGFTNVRVWFRGPVVVSLAAVAWYVWVNVSTHHPFLSRDHLFCSNNCDR